MESSYLGALPAYGIFQRQVIIGDGSSSSFDLDYAVASSTQLLVSFDGVIQEPEYSYSVYSGSGQSTINFSEPLDLNGRCFIVYMGRQLLTATQALSSPYIDSFTGDGSTLAFTMSRPPSVANGANIIVFVGSSFQIYGTDYTAAGEVLTFSSAPSGSAKITAIQLAESNNVIDTVEDSSITRAKLSIPYTPSYFVGDGSTTDFTITSGYATDSVLVFIDGQCSVPTDDYTVSGTTLSFSVAPTNSSRIIVRYLP